MARLEERVEAEPIGPDSLEALFRELIAEQLGSQGLIEAIRAGEVDEGRVRELTDRCRELFAPRLEAARAAGRVRARHHDRAPDRDAGDDRRRARRAGTIGPSASGRRHWPLKSPSKGYDRGA